jgi:predicted Zn-dependent protease with MMP-like domain
MNQRNRDIFDQQVEWVLARLPRSIHRILGEVPLHVEDRPSKDLMRDLKIDDAEELCGYFCGVSYTEGGRYFGTSVYIAPGVPMSNSITIFRQGVVAASMDEWGKVSRKNLRQQIRITILHELAHLLGMSEEAITEIGYG